MGTYRVSFWFCIATSVFWAHQSEAQQPPAELEGSLSEQEALIRKQQQQLQLQEERLDRLEAKLADQDAESNSGRLAEAEPRNARDGVGDLNSTAVSEGGFPGAIKLPGSQNISLAIGGLIKTVAIVDSDAEAMGADFIPATLGTRRPDQEGAFNIDSTLSRVFLDGRAPARNGELKAYVEWDLNKGNDGNIDVKMRHAFGSWSTGTGTLTAGHTWSTMMDISILPEGLTEPTVSGVIFTRQPQIRWSQPLNRFTLHAAIEDPSSTDVFDESQDPNFADTVQPDMVVGLEFDPSSTLHLRLNSLYRKLKVRVPSGGEESANAWGAALSGGITLSNNDKWVLVGVRGRGLGRYLLGIQPTAGGAINPATEDLELRDNTGLTTTYRHNWSPTWRSTAMLGYAKSDARSWQPASTFESTVYSSVNLMWQVLPYLTLGAEYAYGRSEDKSGDELDNHRIAIGFQFF